MTRLERMVNSFFRDSVIDNCFNINANIRHTENAYEADFVVPGFSKNEISVSVEDRFLVVEAVKTNNGDKIVKRNSSIYFPYGTSFEEITAKLENGILTVSVPREKTDSKFKKVEIQ